MSDLIKREDVLIALLNKGQRSRRYKCGETWELDFDEIREAIGAIPSDDDNWIPVSERLPSEECYYLCCNKGYLPFTAHYYDGQWHDFDGTTPHVDAWQPLPQPYKGE